VHFSEIKKRGAPYFLEFAQIFRGFSCIFDKSYLFGMHLHPLPLTPFLLM